MTITYAAALLCELSSTRTGAAFDWDYYTGSTVRQELYIPDVPVMYSLSFHFLLYASYCMALAFLLPVTHTSPRSGLENRFSALRAYSFIYRSPYRVPFDYLITHRQRDKA